MSPVQRPVSGPALTFDLQEEMRVVHEQLGSKTGPNSRTARTLVKNDTLSATLMGLAAGGETAVHSADGPITVHVLDGAVEFEAAGQTWPLAAGALLALGPGVVHRVRSAEGGVFLLTVTSASTEERTATGG